MRKKVCTKPFRLFGTKYLIGIGISMRCFFSMRYWRNMLYLPFPILLFIFYRDNYRQTSEDFVHFWLLFKKKPSISIKGYKDVIKRVNEQTSLDSFKDKESNRN